MRLGVNWHLKFRQRIEHLENKILKLEIQNRNLKKALIKQYKEECENNHTGPTRNGQDNNIVEFSRPIHSTRD